MSFDDHFSQATLFYRSLTPIEQMHVVEAYTFELGKCFETPIRERVLTVLANVDADLCAQVAAGIGLPAPDGKAAEDVIQSPALSQIVSDPGPIAGRKIAVIADAGSDLAGIAKLRRAAERHGATLLVLSATGGVLQKGKTALTVDRTYLTARSIEFDAIVVAGGTTPTGDIKQVILLQEAYRHCKAFAAWDDGAAILTDAGIDVDGPGVSIGASMDKTFTDELVAAIGLHRAWERAELVMVSAVPPTSTAPTTSRRH